MAVKTKCAGVDVRELKVGKPVISTDIMGNRNIEVRAVGAWVQPEAELTGYELQHGVVSARQEENRLRQSQIEKEERLKNFQREVKRRVKALDKVKKLKMIEKSVKEIEAERKIVQQSAFAKGQKKDNCFVHKQSNIAIRSPRSKKIKGRPEYESNDASQGLPLQAFSNKKQQTHTVVSQARRNLVSRQVMMESPSDEDDNAECHIDNRLTERLTGHPCQSEEDKMLGLCNGLSDINLKQHSRPRNVHFDLPSESVSEKDNQSFRHTVRPSRSNTGVHVAGVPEIYSGVLTEDEKRRKQMQHALYRRLFMDIEREQVKENQRRKDHRKRIARLKEQKEANRRQEEDTAWTLVEPRDPVTGETQGETILRERAEQVTALNALEQQQAQRQKAREMQRYLDALKYRLRDRIESRDLQLPPLCCCGETIWDTNPDTCANNCVFYRNPKCYAKALQSLLSSFDV